MSKFVQVRTQLQNPEIIKLALDDLKLRYTEDATYRHWWSGSSHAVPLLVSDGTLSFGLRPTERDVYEAVGDEMQLRRIRPLLDSITQRYAYHMVLTETEKAGFSLVEEAVGHDNVIRMTVRKWT